MPTFSQKSLEKLNTCHPDLQKIFNIAIKHYDITILEGSRTKERQEELVRTGMSKTMDSKHIPQADGYSYAVDFALYPVDWNNREAFIYMAGVIQGIAIDLFEKGEIKHLIRTGTDWDNDQNFKNSSFFDGPHVELIKKT